MPPRKRLAAVAPQPAPPASPDLRDAVQESLDAMDWLAGSDAGLRALALRFAVEIEAAQTHADELAALMEQAGGDRDLYRRLQKLEARCDVTKVVGWLGPQLQGVLRDLGGTPAARTAMKPDKPIGGRLAQLRAAAADREHDA